MEFLLKNKILAAIVIVVIAAAGWYFLGGGSGGSDSVITAQVSNVPPDAQQLIDSLNTLRSVKLDGAIFQNPSFQSLKDFSTPINPEPIGRDDPFKPFEGGAAAPPSAAAPTH